MPETTFIVDRSNVTPPTSASPVAKVRYYARIVIHGTIPAKPRGRRDVSYSLEFLRPDSILPWEAGFPFPEHSFNPVALRAQSFLLAWQYPAVLEMLNSGKRLLVTLNPHQPSANRIEYAPVTLAPAPGTPPDVQAWLGENGPVAITIAWQSDATTYRRYYEWTDAERAELTTAFAKAWNRQSLGLTDPPANIGTMDRTVLAPGDARALYLAYVAQCLAVEIGGWVPWSMLGLGGEIARLLDPGWIVGSWNSQDKGLQVGSLVTPAPPDVVYRFLVQNGIIGSTRRETIERLLEWCRQNLLHALGSAPQNWVPFWGYDGLTPVSRMIAGTLADTGVGQRWAHWTGGCGYTTDFLQCVLRVVNIPVERRLLANRALHTSPVFTSEGKALSHGDDLYSRASKATPAIPISRLLIDASQLDAWFDPALPVPDQLKNVGRQGLVLDAQYLSDDCLHRNEQDKAAGSSPAQSSVYAGLASAFTVQELMGANFWGRLDEKMAAFEGLEEPGRKRKPPGPFAPKKPRIHRPKPRKGARATSRVKVNAKVKGKRTGTKQGTRKRTRTKPKKANG